MDTGVTGFSAIAGTVVVDTAGGVVAGEGGTAGCCPVHPANNTNADTIKTIHNIPRIFIDFRNLWRTITVSV
jgi:hypothetical protein